MTRGLRDRGHEVEVVAAHPHYPEPRWGTRRLPYREVREGLRTLRLPLGPLSTRLSSSERRSEPTTAAQTTVAGITTVHRMRRVTSIADVQATLTD